MDELLLLDSPKRAVLRYSESGRWLGELPGAVPGYLKTWVPRTLLDAGDGKFLIQVDGNRFAGIDETYSFERMTKRAVSDGASVDQMFSSTLARGKSGAGDIVGFADVLQAEGSRDRGFVRFPVDGLKGFQWLIRGIHDPERDFYKLGFPLITSIGTTAYLIRMENPVTLYRHGPGDLVLTAMASLVDYADTHPLPQLPRLRLPEDFPHALNVIDRSSMPVGLYAFDRWLYILLREASLEATSWSLMVVDPKENGGAGSVVHTLSLSFATGLSPEYLTIVPGPRHWAILLKGPTTGLVSQDVYRLVLADSQLFRPPFRFGPKIRCE